MMEKLATIALAVALAAGALLGYVAGVQDAKRHAPACLTETLPQELEGMAQRLLQVSREGRGA
jgi:hypothetical protein